MTTQQIQPFLWLWNSLTIKTENANCSPSCALCTGGLGIWSILGPLIRHGVMDFYEGEDDTKKCRPNNVLLQLNQLLCVLNFPAQYREESSCWGLGGLGNSGCLIFIWPLFPGWLHLNQVFQSSEHLWTIQYASTKFLFCNLQQRTLINKLGS